MPDIRMTRKDPVTNRITLEIQNDYVSGIDLLVQMVVIDLLSSPGSDILDRDIGAGIPGLIGVNLDPDDMSELETDIALKLSQTKARILSDQVGVSATPEERLRNLELVRVVPYPDEGRIDIRLRIENEAGRTTSVVL